MYLFTKIYQISIFLRNKFIGLFFPIKSYLKYKQNFLLLPDCCDTSLDEQYKIGNIVYLKKPILEYYNKLETLITQEVHNKRGYTIIRASDGEAFFLQGKLVGNAPKRHFTSGKKLDLEYVEKFKKGLLDCDSRHIEMYKNNREKFFNIYGKNIFSEIPFECIYALISSRRLLKMNFRLGLIGSDKKLEIIQRLLRSEEYRQYIGRSKFEDYVPVPERGTSNNVNAVIEMIRQKLKDDVDIYLVGIGIAKLAVMPELKKYCRAVFLDIGAGMSALAGLVSHGRPFFGQWHNFRLKNYNYDNVDIMDVDMKTTYIVDA